MLTLQNNKYFWIILFTSHLTPYSIVINSITGNKPFQIIFHDKNHIV